MNANPVCVIDDDEDVRAILCYALEFEGLPTLPMKSALIAIEYLKHLSFEQLPSLIIVDYMMDGMTGFEFINYVRKYFPDTLGKIPLALSSGNAFNTKEVPSDVEVLTKPVELKHLLEVARRHCQSSPLHF